MTNQPDFNDDSAKYGQLTTDIPSEVHLGGPSQIEILSLGGIVTRMITLVANYPQIIRDPDFLQNYKEYSPSHRAYLDYKMLERELDRKDKEYQTRE